MNELIKLRTKIDQIDKNLCKLINERQSLADQIIKAKGTKFPFDPKRENKLLKKICFYHEKLNIQNINQNMLHKLQ